jgi:hypothetical protein
MSQVAKLSLALMLPAAVLIVAPPIFGHQYPDHIRDRVTAVKDVPKAGGRAFKFEDRLTGAEARDPVRQNCFAKAHVVELEPGDYQIDLMSSQFDCYLRLEDAQGNRIAENDDGGDGLNSRLYHSVKVPAKFRLIATTFRPGATGAYTLTVQERGKVAGMPGGGFGKKKVIIMPGKELP